MSRGIGLYRVKDGRGLKEKIKEKFRKEGKYWTKEIRKIGLTPSNIELLDKYKEISPRSLQIYKKLLGEDELRKYIEF